MPHSPKVVQKGLFVQGKFIVIEEYRTLTDAAKTLNVGRSYLGKILKGKINRIKPLSDYDWKFKNHTYVFSSFKLPKNF